MKIDQKNIKYLKALGITILAFLLSQVLLSPLTFSAATMISTPGRSDFTITDFYCHVADKRAVRVLDHDVVIVDIGACDRDDIAGILEIVSVCEPRAVGVDILFGKPHEDDSRLINALRGCPNLVMALSVKPDTTDIQRFAIDHRSFLADSLSPLTAAGATNFPTTESDRTIRDFRVEFPCASDTVPSFALALAEIAAPLQVEHLRQRGNREEVINFCSRTYTTYLPEELPDNADRLRDKIVLLGSLSQTEDMHTTPVKSAMTGVMIHAHALSTILSEEYFFKLNKWWNWAIAFVSCFSVVAMSMFVPVSIKSMSMGVFQIILLYITIRYGYDLFIDFNIIVNFSYSLLMITFGLLANDFWVGTEGCLGWMKGKMAKIRTFKLKINTSR